jgi:hypothetical protein
MTGGPGRSAAGGGESLTGGLWVSVGEEAREVPFRGEAILGRGSFGGWAECFPLGLLLLFLFIFDFLFYFWFNSILLQI